MADAVTTDPATATTTAGAEKTEAPADKVEAKTETSLLGSDAAEKTTEEKPDGEAKAQEPVADIEVELPEGIEADAVLLEEFKPIAKELGLDSAKAQRLIDLAVKMQNRWVEKGQEHYTNTNKQWVEQVKADKDVGGAKFKDSVGAARSAIKHFGGPELGKAIDELGIGNHPVLFRAFVKIGKALAEDSVAGEVAGGTRSDEEVQHRKMYPSMYANKEE